MSNFAAMTRSKSLFILLIVLVVIGCLASWLTVRLILNHPCSASLRPTAGPIPGLATEKGPNIDLISGTIYGRHVFSLGLEEVTDLLGRPSFVSSPDIPGNGAHLAYAEKGLAFYFKDPDVDSHQTCWGFAVFLASTNTTSDGGPFRAFVGKVNHGIDGSWKAKDVMKAFAEYKPHDNYDAGLASLERVAKDMDATLRKMGKEPTSDVPSINQVVMVLSNCVVQFQYEENTKFIERILVADRKSPASQ